MSRRSSGHLLGVALLSSALAACASTAGDVDEGPPTTPLFDGSSLDGWHVDIPAADDDPTVGPAFIVRDGMLVSLGYPLGHLITNEEILGTTGSTSSTGFPVKWATAAS